MQLPVIYSRMGFAGAAITAVCAWVFRIWMGFQCVPDCIFPCLWPHLYHPYREAE